MILFGKQAGHGLINRLFLPVLVCLWVQCREPGAGIQTVTGFHPALEHERWLPHEHILVDFTGADSLDPDWNHDTVLQAALPFLQELRDHEVAYFVDATPAYLGRDVRLLEKAAQKTGMQIITNTGFYGAVQNKYIPAFAFALEPEALADLWTGEWIHGIEGTTVKPGFIKIGVDASDPLHPMQEKLVKAAAICHLKTGLTIASHTGEARGLWPQLKILEESRVSAGAFIWVHAQNEKENQNYLRAAASGCWISFDGLGWELPNHVDKLVYAREQGFLDQVLISHDAGWYDPGKTDQNIRAYTAIFRDLIPVLKAKGFRDEDLDLLLEKNPARAFRIAKRKL